MSLTTPQVAGQTLIVHSSQHLPEEHPEVYTGAAKVSTQLSLAQAVYTRRSEFTRPHNVRIRIGTWNVASFKNTEKDLGDWFVGGKGIAESLSGIHVSEGSKNEDASEHGGGNNREGVDAQEDRWRNAGSKASTIPRNDQGSLPGDDEVGIYALGLQEVVDINSATEALRPYTDTAPANKYKDALVKAMPKGYQLIAERQLIGLLLLIYASPSIAPHIKSVSTTSVGTGLMGYMGNKGAVTARLILGETTRLVFINSHFSAGTGKAESERRNWDAAQIQSRTRFDPIIDDCGITHAAERIGDEDFAFWFGDLNYRLDGIPPEDVRRILMLHTKNQYDIGHKSERKIEEQISQATEAIRNRNRASTASSRGSASTTSTQPSVATDKKSMYTPTTTNESDDSRIDELDPTSLQTTIDSLLPHDELLQQQRGLRMFHDGWREGPITFLPTYKYDRGTVGVFDSGEKKRGPSWCDRILFRTRNDRLVYEERVKAGEEALKKDNDMKAKGIDKAADDENTLFEYDPDADGDDDYNETNSQGADRQSSDDVITKEGYQDNIRLEYYTSHMRVLSSDHKPLDAGFILKYDAIIPELKSKVQQEVARELDKAENEGRPVLTMVVDANSNDDNPKFDGVDFGKLKFDTASTRFVTIANTGRVPAQFGFTNRPDDITNSTTRWITVIVGRASDKGKPSKDDEEWYAGVPKVFSLYPGESCTVEITARVSDKDLIRSLKSDQGLEDVLVLRIKNGRDHFLPVRAHWTHSSHGLKLEKLLRVPEGSFRKLQNQHPSGSWSRGGRELTQSREQQEDGDGGSGNAVIIGEVPVQITALTGCIEALVERVLAEWSILNPSPHTPGGTNAVEEEGELPPWAEDPGWPFIPKSYSRPLLGHDGNASTSETYTSDQFKAAIISNMADNNDDLLANLLTSTHLTTPLLPTVQKLHALTSVFLQFLDYIPNGIVTPSLWKSLAPLLTSSSHPFADRDLAVIEEILRLLPSHYATVMHLVRFLARMAGEMNWSLRESLNVAQLRRRGFFALVEESAKARGMKAKGAQRLEDNEDAIKTAIMKRYAVLFAELVVRSEDEDEDPSELQEHDGIDSAAGWDESNAARDALWSSVADTEDIDAKARLLELLMARSAASAG